MTTIPATPTQAPIPRQRRLTRRRFLYTALGSAATALGYTALVEPFWLEVVHRPLALPNLPSELRGLRMVQLSDLHVCARVSESYLLQSFERIAALDADIVVYTGDFITHSADMHQRFGRAVPKLPKGRLATLAVLGNHDYGQAWSEPECANAVVRRAAERGIRVLRNEAVQVRGLNMVGLDDLWAGRSQPAVALARVEAGPTIMLSHNPDSLDVGDWRGYNGWVLSGHTHGGQCKPPFLPAPLLPVKNRRYTAGVVPLADGRTLYINRGLGYLHQVRFNVRPEVTVFTLT